jgi:hypothetical protein
MRPFDGADPAYWTAYDYHMVEREARAMQRAQVYATISRFASVVYRRAKWGVRHIRSTVVIAKQQRWTPSS